MTIINTTLPLTLDDMKSVITTPDAQVVVDYSQSRLTGRTALIYLANGNLARATIKVDGVDKDSVYELIDAYITLKSTLPNTNLIASVAQILLTVKQANLPVIDQQSIDSFSLITRDQVSDYLSNQARADNVLKLVHVLDNIPTYVTFCNEGLKPLLGTSEGVPVINDIDYTGYPFVNLFELEAFVVAYYSAPRLTQLAYFSQQYDQYMYGGKNLFALLSGTFLLAVVNEITSERMTVEQIAAAQAEIEDVSVNTPTA